MKNGDLPHPRAVIILKVPFCLPVTWQNCPWLVWVPPPSLSSTHSWWEQNCCTQCLKLCFESSSTTELHTNTAGRNKPEPLGAFSPIQVSVQKAMLKPTLSWSHSSYKRLCRKLFPPLYMGFLGQVAKCCCWNPSDRLVAVLEYLHCLHLQPWDE